MTFLLLNGRAVDLRSGSVMDAARQVATLRPQASEVLNLLAARPGTLVTKDELMQTVWPGIAVTGDSLVQCIKEIRQAIGDDKHQVITTVVKRGYVLRIDASPQNTTLSASAKGPGATTSAVPPWVLEQLPSIAVLPFTNMSSDAEQEFFADGLTDDLITELSKAPGLFVIARHSCFTFKNKPVDVRQVARELGVRYIVEGSARRSAARIRINAQLVDAREGGGHLWAERFDRDLADIFAVQDEVVARIVEALFGKLAVSKLPDRKPPKSLEAYDLCIQGRFLYLKMMAEENKAARRHFEQAIALDPDYAQAHARLAMTHWQGWTNWFEPVDPHRRLALENARRAVALDPNDPLAHLVLGFVLAYEHDHEESAAQIETALRLDPNDADTYGMRTDLLVMEGRPLDATASIAYALRLNPHPPAWYYWLQGEAEYATRQYEAAVKTLRKEEVRRTAARRLLAASLAQLRRLDEARREAELFMMSNPHFRIGHWEHFVDGYRKAALPE
jgi:TolB-like protein